MTGFFLWFTDLMIGIPGRFIKEMIQNNSSIFLVVMAIYGFLLVYARMILTSYLPKKLRQFVELRMDQLDSDQNEELLQDKLQKEWNKELENLPWYVVVPSRNEFWVKRPTEGYRKTKQLAYRNNKKSIIDDSTMIKQLIGQYSN